MSDTNLRGKLIRLAHEHPEFRKDILPLLKEAGCEKLPEGGMRDNCEAKKEEGKDKADKTAAIWRGKFTVSYVAEEDRDNDGMTQWHGAYTWAEAIKLAKKLAVKSGESATIHEQGYDLVAFVTPEGRVDDGGYGDQYRSKRADQPLGKKAWIDSNNLNAGSIANNLRHLANDLQDVADLPTYDEVRPIVKALRLQMAHLDIVLGNLATSRR